MRRFFAALALVVLAALPVTGHASEQGDPRGKDRAQQGCAVPGSANGLGDTLAIMTRLTCG